MIKPQVSEHCEMDWRGGTLRTTGKEDRILVDDGLVFLYRVSSYAWPCCSGTLQNVTCPLYERHLHSYKILGSAMSWITFNSESGFQS